MNTVINILLEISITSSILILVVLIMHKLFKNKISATIQYSIWILVALRLLMPFSIPSPVSVMNIFNKPQVILTQIVDIDLTNNQDDKTGTILNNAVNENFVEDINDTQPKIQTGDTAIFDIAVIIITVWIIGILCIAGYIIFINEIYLKRTLKDSVEFPNEKTYLLKEICTELKINRNIPVIVNDTISSPCLIGWLNPKIVVTSQALESEKSIQHVLLHELCHYKQKDNWIALLRNMCCSVYWFNPLVWIAAVVSRDDAELACDERVLRHLDYNENTYYGETLLKLISRSNLSVSVINTSTTMSTGGKKMNERIAQIINRPKTIKLAVVCVIAILLAVSGFTLSSAMSIKMSIKTDNDDNDTTIASYSDLEKILSYETLYVGDASAVDKIIEGLSPQTVFYNQNIFSVQTGSESYGLTAIISNKEEQYVKPVNIQSIPLTGIESIEISYLADSITIMEGKNDKIEFREYISSEEESYLAHVTLDGTKIRIESGERPQQSNLQSNLEIYLPKTYHGDLFVETVSGEIFSDVAYSLNKLNASSTAGKVEFNDISAVQEIIAHSTSGKVIFHDISADSINLSCTAGPITVHKAVGSLYIKSTGGDINIGVPEDMSFQFEASATGGNINTYFENLLTKSKNRDRVTVLAVVGQKPDLTVNISTTSGNIQIDKR